MPFSVYVTRPIPEAGTRLLEAECAPLDVGPDDRSLSETELRNAVQNRDAVLCNVGDNVDASVLEAAAPRCKVFANFGVGVNHIDLATAARLRITVTNTPGVLTDATADLAWTLMLAVARRVAEGTSLTRASEWTGWTPTQLLGADVSGQTLGIIGAGRIGKAVGLRSTGFHMSILYVERHNVPQLDRLGATRVALDECLLKSDFVTLHVPLTSDTHHLIGPRELGLMRSNAILINTARGPVVDEAALVDALQAGRLGGAGLDVFEHEPRIHPALLAMPNVVCLPHLGSATIETRDRMAEMVVGDLLRVLHGDAPDHPVSA
jgi:glyoxylate reductase